jgi:hypothetical protein
MMLFTCRSLTSITIPNSVTSIGYGAFSVCTGLTSVIIPNSVTSIGNFAFYHCTGLASVTIPNSVESIGDFAFSGCSSLTEVTIPNGVTSIGERAFYECTSLTEVTIPNSVTNIGNYAFAYCSSLTIIVAENNSAYSSENGVLFNKTKTILIQYPAGKSDVSYIIPNSVTSIGNYAFSGCSSLTEVTIDNSVTSIGERAFHNCSSLTEVTIGNSVTSIGHGAFSECSSLTEVTIGNRVTSIGEWAFYECTSLTEVTNLNPTPQSIASNVFQYVDLSRATLYVPAESIEAYRAAAVWQDFGTIAACVSTAINAPAGENNLWVYPNPVRGNFQIRGLTAPALVAVTDISGKIVWKQTVTGSESIPASSWPAGVYLLRVQGQTVKVVKNKD